MTIHTMKYKDERGTVTGMTYKDGNTSITSFNGYSVESTPLSPCTFINWLEGVTKLMEKKVLVSYETVTV